MSPSKTAPRRKYRIGLDPGNTETTIVGFSNKQRVFRTYSSAVGRGTLSELRRLRGGSRAREALKAGEMVLTVGGVDYFAGELALSGQATQVGTGRGDVGRYYAGHSLRLLLLGVGQLLDAGLMQDVPELYVATGVPVDLWSDKIATRVRTGLCGEHPFSYNGVERLAVVKGVFVTMEGSGALVYLSDGESGEDDEQGVTDIGGGSSDLFYARGLDPILPRCGSLTQGVEQVGIILNDQLREKYDTEIEGDRLRAILHAKAHGKTIPAVPVRTLVSGSQKVKINGELDHAIDAVGHDVQTYIGQKWSDDDGRLAPRASGLYLTGGGTYLFKPHVEQKVGPVKTSDAPERDNANGYADIAASLTYEDWADFAA